MRLKTVTIWHSTNAPKTCPLYCNRLTTDSPNTPSCLNKWKTSRKGWKTCRLRPGSTMDVTSGSTSPLLMKSTMRLRRLVCGLSWSRRSRLSSHCMLILFLRRSKCRIGLGKLTSYCLSWRLLGNHSLRFNQITLPLLQHQKKIRKKIRKKKRKKKKRKKKKRKKKKRKMKKIEKNCDKYLI
jgi:hypothetical protein